MEMKTRRSAMRARGWGSLPPRQPAWDGTWRYAMRAWMIAQTFVRSRPGRLESTHGRDAAIEAYRGASVQAGLDKAARGRVPPVPWGSCQGAWYGGLGRSEEHTD